MYVTQNFSVVDTVLHYLREVSHRQPLKQLIVLNVNTGQFRRLQGEVLGNCSLQCTPGSCPDFVMILQK
jgi:hypothetical protein